MTARAFPVDIPISQQSKQREAQQHERALQTLRLRRDCDLYEETDANGNLNPKSSYLYTKDKLE